MAETARLIAGLLFVAGAAGAQTNPPLAFSGAEGFGRFATGGQGGERVSVTTLNDSGAGSFRDAVSQPHRVVVFEVGGIIRLQSNVAVSSDISILGQTAPSPGITLYGRSVSFSGRSNVIVRYLRFREGISGDRGKCSVNVAGGRDMIFDHCSIEWGRWDCLGVTQGSRDITFQNCIIGEGVDPQRFGALADSVTNITFVRNLWVNNQSRNPKAKGQIQYVNNIIYNWGVCGLVGGHSETEHGLDVVGNYFIAGPDSSPHAVGQFTGTDHVFQSGNFVDLDRNGKLNGRKLLPADFGAGANTPTWEAHLAVAPLTNVTVLPALVALSNVLADAGCSGHRDAVDARLIDAVKSFGLRGRILHHETETVVEPGNR